MCNMSDIIPSYLSKYSSLDSSEILARSTHNKDSPIFPFYAPLLTLFINVYRFSYHIVKVLGSFTILYIIHYITQDRPLFHLG